MKKDKVPLPAYRLSRKIRQSKEDRIFDIVNYTLLVIISLIFLYPLYFTVIASFSDAQDVVKGNVTFWIKGFNLDSYKAVFKFKQLWVGYRNTIIYTVLGTLYNLFLLLPCSYAMSRRGMKGKGILMGIFVFTMYFGGGMIPYYLVIKQLGLVNTPLVMIIPSAFSVYNMIVTRTFFASNFPEELCEAAHIDGAGEFTIFFKLALPLSGAIIAVMALFHALGHWNSYFNALMYLNDNKYYPLQLILRQVLVLSTSISTDMSHLSTEEIAYQLQRAYQAETMKYAIIFIANLPMLVAYPFVQKHFVKGVMVGSIKG